MTKTYDVKDGLGGYTEITGELIFTGNADFTNGPRSDIEYWAAPGTINGVKVQINYEFDATDRPELAEDYDWDDVYSLTVIEAD